MCTGCPISPFTRVNIFFFYDSTDKVAGGIMFPSWPAVRPSVRMSLMGFRSPDNLRTAESQTGYKYV